MIAVDAEDSKGRVQIQPLQAWTLEAPSCPSWGFTLVLLYLTAFWNYCNVASHMGIGRERSATENMHPWDTYVCGVPLGDTYSVAALQGCSLSPAEAPQPWTQLAGRHTGCQTGTLPGVLNRQGRRCRCCARWQEGGGVEQWVTDVPHAQGAPAGPCPYRDEQRTHRNTTLKREKNESEVRFTFTTYPDV